MSFKNYFTRCLQADPERLHFAAHSHHPWPDVSFDGQRQAWLDAAARLDQKWEHVMGEVLPRAQRHIARILNLSDPTSVVFAPNTHELVVRLLSSVEGDGPVRVLTTDSEFHSFSRQSRRWEEAGLVRVERISADPLDDFFERFLAAARSGNHDLIFISHVFYNSAYVLDDLEAVVEAPGPSAPLIVFDGYHGFMALPTDLAPTEDRAFYLGGGYKYAMSGEGVCFMHCPPGYGTRPVNTGWFAGFGELEGGGSTGEVVYREDGHRFAGATFDPTALYRFNAVMDLWAELGVSVADIHDHVQSRQEEFLTLTDELALAPLRSDSLVPGRTAPDRGHFLTFRTPDAADIQKRLAQHRVITDHRGDRLRFGFGLYHDREDVVALGERLSRVLS